MHAYTKCKFCGSEIPLSTIVNAYCNKECKLLKEVYGTPRNYQLKRKSGKKTGNRKTKQTRAKSEPKPIKNDKEFAKTMGGKKSTKKQGGAYMVPVQTSGTKEVSQFLLIMDYGEVAPLLLTGGAISPKKDPNVQG